MPKHEPEVLEARVARVKECGMRVEIRPLTPQEQAHMDALDQYIKAGGLFAASYLHHLRKGAL